jgi:hypothetical protein
MHTPFVLCLMTIASMMTVHVAGAQEAGNPAAVRAAARKSLPVLEASGHTWIERAGCASCHHQSLPAMTFGLAKARGFAVDPELARERLRSTLARWEEAREELFQANTGSLVRGAHGAAYTLFGLAAEGVPPNMTTDAIAHYVSALQLRDGRFAGQNYMRPPLEHDDVTATALSIRALHAYAPRGRQHEVAEIVGRARFWLASILPAGMEEQSFQLQGLAWAGADSREIARRVAAIVAAQRPDGGWAQFPTLASDAYATGQALVALHQAGGLPTTSPVYANGVKFLLGAQQTDGSWLVRSRSRGTQPYVESGFPYGANQFISAAGTAWATSALLLTLEVTDQ